MSSSLDLARRAVGMSLPSATCGDRVVGSWLPRRWRLEGMPRAEARLLAMEEVRSRCGDASSGGGCWEMWRGELSRVFVSVMEGGGDGSCSGEEGWAVVDTGWTSCGRNLRSSASFWWCCSRSLRVRSAWLFISLCWYWRALGISIPRYQWLSGPRWRTRRLRDRALRWRLWNWPCGSLRRHSWRASVPRMVSREA